MSNRADYDTCHIEASQLFLGVESDREVTMPLRRDRKSQPAISLLGVKRMYDTRSDQRQSEHVRILYAVGERASQVRGSIAWEAMAQLRSEMARSGQSIEDAELGQSSAGAVGA